MEERMKRSAGCAIAIAAAAVLGACSQPSVATSSQSSDCPRDAICVTGICQKGVPSGGASSAVAGSARVSAGAMTMDVVVGQPVAPAGAAGAKTVVPAENTR
jgi:hypothetical protein